MDIVNAITQKYDKRLFITMLLCLIILAPLLAFPLGWDQAIFMKIAKILLNGGTIYKDAIDLKPPMVYYFFELIIRIFGSSDFSMRLAEFCLNMISCYLLYFMLNKLATDSPAKYFSPIIYSLVYTSLILADNFQSETIITPAFLLLIYLSIHGKQTGLRLSIIGLLFALAFTFKFTFIIYFFSWLICYYFTSKPKIKNLAIVIFVFLAVSAIIMSTAIVGNTKPFMEMMNYLSFYSSSAKWSPYLVYFAYLSFTSFIYSVVSFFVMLGAFTVFWHKRDVYTDSNLSRLVLYSSVFILVGLISVIIENKFFVYHFSRILIFISILCGIGLVPILNAFRQNIKSKMVAVPIIVLLVLLSPIPQSILNYKAPIFLKIGMIDRYNELFYKLDPYKALNLSEKSYIIDRIRSDKTRNSYKTSFFCPSGAIFSRMIGNETYSRFANSQFMLGDGMPEQWHLWVRDEIDSSDWIVANNNHNCSLLLNNGMTIFERIKADLSYNLVLERRYVHLFDTECYTVYRRK